MKKLIIILISIFLITGCNSYTELNDLAIINAIGIEKKDDTYTLYASIIDSSNEFEKVTKTYKTNGNNLNKCFDNLNLKLDKKIYLSHLDLLLINDSIKTYELKEIINFFLNNNETREDFLVAYSKNIEEILNKSQFQEINNLVKINHETNSKATYTTMNDIIKNYYEEKEIYLTNISDEEHINIDSLKKLYHNQFTNILIEDSIFINYLINEITTYKYTYECQNGKYLYLNILSSNTRIIKNKLGITNEIKIITNDCHYKKEEIDNLFTKELIKELEKLTNKKISINNTIRGNYEK